MNIADRVCVAMPEWKAFPRIDISNVADFLFPDWFGRDVHADKDLPNIAPPWRDAVFFWTYPKGSGDVAGIEVLVYAHANRIRYSMPSEADIEGNRSVRWTTDMDAPREGGEDGWRIEMEFYDSDDRFGRAYGIDPKVYELNSGRRVQDGGWPVRVAVFVDAAGKFVVNETGVTDPGIRMGIEKHPKLLSWIEQEVRGLSTVVLFALSFVHCKNVTVEERVPNPKLAKKQLKHRGVPKLSYHVLMIEPMRKVLREEGDLGTKSDLHRALHICRGHFKDYRDGAGLFGKHREVYWWEQNIRGSKKAGLTLKDYKVGDVRREGDRT